MGSDALEHEIEWREKWKRREAAHLRTLDKVAPSQHLNGPQLNDQKVEESFQPTQTTVAESTKCEIYVKYMRMRII